MVLGLWPEVSASAGPDATICADESFVITGASAVDYASLIWSTSGDGNFNSTSSLNPTYTPGLNDISGGNVTLTLTVAPVTGSECPVIVDELELTIDEIPEITITDLVNTQCNAAVGSVTLESVGNLISLNGGTPIASPATFSNFAAGYYEATTSGDCPGTIGFNIINQNSTLFAYLADSDNVSCNGGSDGEALIFVNGGNGPYEYSLNGQTPQTNGLFLGLTTGSYNVEVTDANGCSYLVAFTITQPAPLEIGLANQNNVSCSGDNNGSVSLITSGGAPGYIYTIFDSPIGSMATVNGNLITGMIAGNYTILVTDANGCTDDLVLNISEPINVLNITSADVTDVSCFEGTDGEVDIVVEGGTPPYNFAWSSGDNVQNPSTLEAGVYVVTITDINGCQFISDPYMVGEPAQETITVTDLQNTECNLGVGSVVLTSSDGSDITLNGVTLPSGSTFTDLFAGYYTATTLGICPAEVSFNIINTNSTLTGVAFYDDIACFNGTTTVFISASGGASPYLYSINESPADPSNEFANLSSGSYVFTIIDDNGCTFEIGVDIEEPTPVELSAS